MSKPAPLSWLLPILVPLTAVVGVLFGVIVLGRLAREHLGEKGKVDFAAIECAAPLGLSRAEFLGEVQYLAGLPDRLEPSDDLVKKLFAAFVRHPWVAEVQGIKISPEQQVRIRLRFRTPVLAVEQSGTKRAVDETGFRLPEAAPTEGLPVLHQSGAAGTAWDDDEVKAAARRASLKTP